MEPIWCSWKDTRKRRAVNGGAWFYDLRFQAVPQNKLQTPNEQEAAYWFKVELEVTNSLMACGKWPTTPSDEKELQFFQYVKEELQKREPPGRNEIIPLRLGSFTDNPSGKKGRFEDGPIYQWPVMPRPEGRGYKGRLRVDKGICDMIAGQYAQADRTCGLRFEVPLGVGAEVSQIPVGGSY